MQVNGRGEYNVSAYVKVLRHPDRTHRDRPDIRPQRSHDHDLPIHHRRRHEHRVDLVSGTVNLTWSGTLTNADFFVNSASGTTTLLVDNCSMMRAGGTSAPAAPTFNQAAGTYTAPVSVTISAASGTTIYYTLNGTTPTASTGTLYTAAVSISSTATLKAIAIAGGLETAPTSALYTIDIPVPPLDLLRSTAASSREPPAGPSRRRTRQPRPRPRTEPREAQRLALGSGNSTANGVVSQTVETTNGAAGELLFWYAPFGASGKQQQLRVDILSDATTVIATATFTATGVNNYTPANTVFHAEERHLHSRFRRDHGAVYRRDERRQHHEL